jgi:hypothetical protein
MQNNEERINSSPPMRMSTVAEQLMASLDFGYASRRRLANWRVLREALGKENEMPALPDPEKTGGVPLFYPWLRRMPGLREKLIRQNVYIPQYWPGFEEHLPQGSLEESLQRHLLPLPLDQRYDAGDMQCLLKIVQGSAR